MDRLQKSQKKKRRLGLVSLSLAISLFSVPLLGGCSPKTEDPQLTTAAPFQEET